MSGIFCIVSWGGWLSCIVLFWFVKFFLQCGAKCSEKLIRGMKISTSGKVSFAMSISLCVEIVEMGIIFIVDPKR